MGRGGDDGGIIVVGVCCFCIGAPILGVGIWMLIAGQSGGTVNFDICCSQVDGEACVEYVTHTTCPPWGEERPTESEPITVTVDKSLMRKDNSYIIKAIAPYGAGVAGSATLVAGTDTVIDHAILLAKQETVDAEIWCDKQKQSKTNVIQNWPPVATQELESGIKFKTLLKDNDASLQLTVEATVEDPLGVIIPNAIGKAVYPPQLFIDDKGLSTLSAWGVVMIVIGSILVAPCVCTILAAS